MASIHLYSSSFGHLLPHTAWAPREEQLLCNEMIRSFKKKMKTRLALRHHSAARLCFFLVIFQPLLSITLPNPYCPDQPIFTIVTAEQRAKASVEPERIPYLFRCPSVTRTWQKIFPWKVYISPPRSHLVCPSPVWVPPMARWRELSSPPRSLTQDTLILRRLGGSDPRRPQRLAKSNPLLIASRILSQCHLNV